MTSPGTSDPVVRRLLAAINDGDRDAFLATLTPHATLTDDGNPRSVHDRIDREIFSAHGHMNVEHEMAGLPQSEISHPARRHIRGVSQPAAQVLDSAVSPAAS